MRSILIPAVLLAASLVQAQPGTPPDTEPRVESIALTGEARDQAYRRLYALAAATTAAGFAGYAIRRKMLRGLAQE